MQDTIETVSMLAVKGVLVPVIGLFLAWASAKLPAWITSHVKNQREAAILNKLATLSLTVVQEVDQTVVSGLGNKVTKAALVAAKDQALETLKSHLGAQGLQEIEQVLGLENQDAVIKMLVSFIEQSVHSLKLSTPAA
jgi:hypothetical protein